MGFPMDEHLKRRLLGAAILTALSVLIIPYFFEDKPPKSAVDLPIPLDSEKKLEPVESPAAMPPLQKEVGQETQPVAASRKRKYDTVPLDEPQAVAPHGAAQVDPEVGISRNLEEDVTEREAPPPVPAKPREIPASPPQLTPKLQKPVPPPVSVPSSTQTPNPVKTTPQKKAEPAKPQKPPATVQTQGDGVTAKKPGLVADAPKKSGAPVPSPKSSASTTTQPQTKSSQASPPAAGYLVQAGTFSDENNAKTLVEKLKKRNLPVRLQPIDSGNGNKVYRVTVGSNLERSKAEQIQKQLADQDGVRGLILQTR